MPANFRAASFHSLSSYGGVSCADCLAALLALTNSHIDYTLAALPQQDAAYDSDIKVVWFIADDAELTGDAAPLAAANNPNALCRHKWSSLDSFEISGFHALEDTAKSVFGAAGRLGLFVRPQQGYSRTGHNNGDGHGRDHYSGLNGAQDPEVNGGADTTIQSGTDLFACEGPIYRWDDGTNPGSSPGSANNGFLPTEDPTGLGEVGKIRLASDPDWPGMWWGQYRAWDRISPLSGWELYDTANGIYVNGGAQGTNSGYILSAGGSYMECTVDDMTLSAKTLLQRHVLACHDNIAALQAGGGRVAVLPGSTGGGGFAKIFTWNISIFTDVTAAAGAPPGTLTVCPLGAPDGTAIYFISSNKFNAVQVAPFGTWIGQIGATGVWEYSQGGDTWNTFSASVDGSANFTARGTFNFVPAADWATDMVNGTAGYVVRWRKTGGTVVQADSIDVISKPSLFPLFRVKTFDGSATYTDVTSEANTAVTDDFEVLAAGAANNASIIFMAEAPFSLLTLNLAQVRIGGTGIWEYSQGDGSWAALTTVSDPTAGFTTNTSQVDVVFNPKIDWASDTIDGDTGYAVRWRKTGGTVTQAARGDQVLGYRHAAVYIRRWDDSEPTEGIFHSSVRGGTNICYRLNTDGGKGNIELWRLRQIGGLPFTATPSDLTVKGAQIACFTGLQHNIALAWRFGVAQAGTRWWAVDDHNHQDKNDPFIQGIIQRVQYALDHLDDDTVDAVTGNTVGEDLAADLAECGITMPDLTAFDDMEDWSDFAYGGSGPYGSNNAATLIFDGFKLRNIPGLLTNANGDEILHITSNDNHMLAQYGGHDAEALGCQYKRFALENGNRMLDYYPQGAASNLGDGNLKPVVSSGAARRNMHIQYGYLSGFSGLDESASFRGHNGIFFESDSDAGKYDDGTGDSSGNNVAFMGIKDIGGGFSNLTPNSIVKVLCSHFDNTTNSAEVWGGFNNHGQRSTNTIRFDGTDTYTDITTNVHATGNISTDMFDTGTAGEMILFGCTYQQIRRLRLVVTVAGVGDAMLALRYWDGAAWQDAVNVSGLDLSSVGTKSVLWDRPIDGALRTQASKTIYSVAIVIVSGSFSTIPEVDDVRAQLEGASLYFKHNKIVNFEDGAGGIRLQVGAGTFDDNECAIISDWNEWVLSEGQDEDTPIFSGNALATKSFAQWQAQQKLAINSDAERDSVFDPQSTLTPAV